MIVLPVWYCAPSETAAACKKECVQSAATANEAPSCQIGFNAVTLLPLVAVPGLFLPPPEDLPTLTIGDGDAKKFTSESDPTPKDELKASSQTPTPTPTPSVKEEPPKVSCAAPVNKVADKARPAVSTESLGGTATSVPATPPDIETNPLTFLKSTQPGALSSCRGGGFEGRYFSYGFYQFGNTFARTDDQCSQSILRSSCQEWICFGSRREQQLRWP